MSLTELETVNLHLIWVTTSLTGTGVLIVTLKPWNLSFSLTLESGPSNTSAHLPAYLSPAISTEWITEDSFLRCAKANYSDGKSVC